MLRALFRSIAGTPFHNVLGFFFGIIGAVAFYAISGIIYAWGGIGALTAFTATEHIFWITFIGIGLGLYRHGRVGYVLGGIVGWLLSVQLGIVTLNRIF